MTEQPDWLTNQQCVTDSQVGVMTGATDMFCQLSGPGDKKRK